MGLALAVFAALFVALAALSEFLFFEPYLVFYVPEDRALVFATAVAVSALSAVVIPMNVYRVAAYREGARRMGGGFLGSIIGVSAGACSCGPLGFAMVSTFGTIGGVATSFLTVYEIPMRVLSIGLLAYVYYATARSIGKQCKTV